MVGEGGSRMRVSLMDENELEAHGDQGVCLMNTIIGAFVIAPCA